MADSLFMKIFNIRNEHVKRTKQMAISNKSTSTHTNFHTHKTKIISSNEMNLSPQESKDT